ncbi:MAG TPA: L-ribulose-5-phosphate 4-epimerase AraD [Clostridiales bacterium]|nr:MAG: L-ribulose-5-phosphate 4-epimerase [Firmicutes bacterium ADurb.Bin262]HOU09851.1 L-ribulose-5-phosphate 4-epimerase AraD [Clostridiales bacterium]HQH63177.1 L-ribulose-5-phosphate 4-epimerase AraD [Clostridiales bacterium]HQK73406.1 L-ribulose-5-phosphate 4-epimerase AraD [Clostridiales bacterium]
MLEELREKVCRANIMLQTLGLVQMTWGNASGISREKNLIVIKPSGVAYDALTPDKMVIVDMRGRKVEGNLNPSSDTPSHVHLYNNFPEIGGVVHTHSTWATVWCQAGRPIPPYGTTHADFAFGYIPCTRALTKAQVKNDYELNTGRAITRFFEENSISYLDIPAVLVHSHGPFTWGADALGAALNAKMLEDTAMTAYYTEMLGQKEPIEPFLLEKHFSRKHGKDAYYGQR